MKCTTCITPGNCSICGIVWPLFTPGTLCVTGTHPCPVDDNTHRTVNNRRNAAWACEAVWWFLHGYVCCFLSWSQSVLSRDVSTQAWNMNWSWLQDRSFGKLFNLGNYSLMMYLTLVMHWQQMGLTWIVTRVAPCQHWRDDTATVRIPTGCHSIKHYINLNWSQKSCQYYHH